MRSTLLSIFVAFLFLLVTGKATAGYFFEGRCYALPADVVVAVQSSYPREDAGRVYYLSAVPTVNATGLLSQTVASKLVTSATVRAGVANTFQLASCAVELPESDQWYQDQTLQAVSAVKGSVASIDLKDDQIFQSINSLRDNVSAVTAAQASAQTITMTQSTVLIIVAMCIVAVFGFSMGKGHT